jgi:hypothetical protein
MAAPVRHDAGVQARQFVTTEVETRAGAPEVTGESANLSHHLIVRWRQCGIALEEVWGEMRHRAGTLGIAEKLPKPAAQIALAVGSGM